MISVIIPVLNEEKALPAQARNYKEGFERASAVIPKYLPEARLTTPTLTLEKFVGRQTALTTLLLGFNVPALGFLLAHQADRVVEHLAQVDLDRTRIVAPFDGVIGSRMVGPGEWVKPETGLVAIAVSTNASVANMNAIHAGQLDAGLAGGGPFIPGRAARLLTRRRGRAYLPGAVWPVDRRADPDDHRRPELQQQYDADAGLSAGLHRSPHVPAGLSQPGRYHKYELSSRWIKIFPRCSARYPVLRR